MRIEYTNFDGDWDEDCPYCGKPHRTHQIDNGTLDDVKYIHRMPCEEERHEIRKSAVKRGITIKAAVTTVDICTYLWSKIPFKDEVKLIASIFKRIYISFRAVMFLNKNKIKHNKRMK